jgi:L-asparaginase
VTTLLVTTGGTIASLPDRETGAVSPALSAADLVASIPELSAVADLEVVELDRVNGWNMTPACMLDVARCLRDGLSASGVVGAVVTHGTDTVEETAFLCDLVVESEKPVAFAAAMRTGAEVAADGPRNLVCAARVAGAPEARGLGAAVVMNDEVHAARWCVKTDSYRTSAFCSPERGPVGHVTPERLAMGPLPPRHTLELPDRLDHEVAIVKTFTGMSDELIEAAAEVSGARGVVMEGTGAGNVPGAATRGISSLVERGVVVVIATRVQTGGTIPIYGGPGGGVTLRELGAIPAGALTAAKARLLLMLTMAVTEEPAAATALFERAVAALAPGALGPA